MPTVTTDRIPTPDNSTLLSGAPALLLVALNVAGGCTYCHGHGEVRSTPADGSVDYRPQPCPACTSTREAIAGALGLDTLPRGPFGLDEARAVCFALLDAEEYFKFERAGR